MTIFKNYSTMKAVGNISLVLAQDEDGANVVDVTFGRYNRFTGVSTPETVRFTRAQFQSAKQAVNAQIDTTTEQLTDLNTEKASVVEFRNDALALLP